MEYWLWKVTNNDGDTEVGGLYTTKCLAEVAYDEWRRGIIREDVEDAPGEMTWAEAEEQFDDYWDNAHIFSLKVQA